LPDQTKNHYRKGSGYFNYDKPDFGPGKTTAMESFLPLPKVGTECGREIKKAEDRMAEVKLNFVIKTTHVAGLSKLRLSIDDLND
jgi:hypothetical protein